MSTRKPGETAPSNRPPAGRRTARPPAPPEADAAASRVPSSLDLDARPSPARSGRAELRQRLRNHPETSPDLTGGDVDADWESAYSVGDEAPGGDNPTPGQTSVEEAARALGIEYQAEEELLGAEEIATRDKHRWELDPASAEDYRDRK